MTQQEVKSLKPKSYEEHMNAGWKNYASEKDTNAAEDCFRQAVSLKPNSGEAHYGLGLALKSQNNDEEALREFETVIDLLDESKDKESSSVVMLLRMTEVHIARIKANK